MEEYKGILGIQAKRENWSGTHLRRPGGLANGDETDELPEENHTPIIIHPLLPVGLREATNH